MQQSGCHQQRKKHELSQGWIPKGHLNPWPSQQTIQETPLHVMHEYGSHPVQCPLTLCRKDEDLHAKRATSRVLRIRCSPQTSTSSRTLTVIHDLVRVEDETGRHRCCNVLFNSGWVLFLVTGVLFSLELRVRFFSPNASTKDFLAVLIDAYKFQTVCFRGRMPWLIPFTDLSEYSWTKQCKQTVLVPTLSRKNSFVPTPL